MSNFEDKQQHYIEAIAAYVLDAGIKGASLKRMAEAAGTSDRMLMHYFKDKHEIETLVLTAISEDLIRLLNQGEGRTLAFRELLLLLNEALQSETVRPYLDLWFEITSLASGGQEPYATVTTNIGQSFWEWLMSVFEADDTIPIERDALVSLLFVVTEGLVVLDKARLAPQMKLAVEALLQLYDRSQ